MRKISKSGFCLLPMLLAACASSPDITLKPVDVPSLYGDPSPVGISARELAQTTASLQEVSTGLASEVAADVAAQAQDGMQAMVATEYEAAMSQQCNALKAEIEKLDSGLGSPASDSAPAPPRTKTQKAGKALYDMAVQTAMGPVQLFIQTKRAIFGDAEKERLRAEALERGTTRRAYLMGYAVAAGCNFPDGSPEPGAGVRDAGLANDDATAPVE